MYKIYYRMKNEYKLQSDHIFYDRDLMMERKAKVEWEFADSGTGR